MSPSTQDDTGNKSTAKEDVPSSANNNNNNFSDIENNPKASKQVSRQSSSSDADDDDDEKVDPTKGPVKNKKIVVALFFLSMSGLMFGLDTGTISGISGSIQFVNVFGDSPVTSYGPDDDRRIHRQFSNRWKGLLVASVYIGAFFGCFLSSPVADRFGRKKSVLFWCCIYCIGVLLQLTTFRSYAQYVVGRVVGGFGIGALSVITPSYQSETSPPQVRGTVVTSYQLMVTLGILLGYCITLGTHTKPDGNWNKPDDQKHPNGFSWRVPTGINMAFGILFICGTLFLPESPRFLMKQGKDEEAHRVIANVQGREIGDPAVETEYNNMEENVHKELEGGPVSWLDIFGPDIRYRTFLGMAVMAFQQLTGNNYFFLYAATTFAGIGVTNPYIASLILGIVNFACTFAGLGVLERFGRRQPLIWGGIWMCICLLIYGGVGTGQFYGNTGETEKRAGQVMICFTCFFIAGFAITWAPCCYVIVSESYPLRYSTKCSAMATASNWILVFLIGFCSSFVTDKIHYNYGFVFAGCNLAGAAIIFFFAKETKGLSLEEINMLYESDVKPWESAGWAKGLSKLDKKSRKDIENDKVKKFEEQKENADVPQDLK